MANIQKRIALFRELVQSCSDLSFWDYTADLTLITPVREEDELMTYFLRYSSVFSDLETYAASGGRLPLILNDSVGLIWSVTFEYEGNTLKFIHVMGPCNMNGESKNAVLEQMDRDNLPIDMRKRLRETLQRIPVLPNTTLFMYTIMFHRCVTGETITASDFQYPASVLENTKKSMEKSLFEAEDENATGPRHVGVSDLDAALMNAIASGNIHYQKIFSTGSKISTGIRMKSFSSLRTGKDSIILFVGLCSRAAIRGGLPPEISYSLCDMYVSLTEGCTTLSELSNLNHTMYDDYVHRVHAYRTKSDYSREIQACCDGSDRIHGILSLPEIPEGGRHVPLRIHRPKKNRARPPAPYIDGQIRPRDQRNALLLLTQLLLCDIFKIRGYITHRFQGKATLK